MNRRLSMLFVIASFVVISGACGGDSSSTRSSTIPSATTVSATSQPNTSSTTPTSMTTSTTANPAAATTTAATNSGAVATSSPKNQTPTTSRASTTSTTLPGSVNVSPTVNQVLILSTGPGPLLINSITDVSGNGLIVDISDCGSIMPSGNVCVVRFTTTGLPSGTVTARLRVDSNAATSPDIVDVPVVIP